MYDLCSVLPTGFLIDLLKSSSGLDQRSIIGLQDAVCRANETLGVIRRTL